MREFGQALHSGPFRVALVLSLIVHLALLAAWGGGRLGRESRGERRVPLMRARLLRPTSPPAAFPAAPPLKRERQQPRRQQPGRPAAESRSGARAVAPPAAAVPAPVDLEEPAPGPGTGATGHEEPRVPAVASGAVPTSVAPGIEIQRSGRAAAIFAPAAMPVDSDGSETGPRDFSAVRSRIDAQKIYPRIAVRNGWEGRVLVEMRLAGDGSLSGVRLLEGSGYAVLDAATITAVRRASPFPPIARILHVPVEYRLR